MVIYFHDTYSAHDLIPPIHDLNLEIMIKFTKVYQGEVFVGFSSKFLLIKPQNHVSFSNTHQMVQRVDICQKPSILLERKRGIHYLGEGRLKKMILK